MLSLVALATAIPPATSSGEIPGPIVAVLDTGIDPSHPAFVPGQVVAWRDFVANLPNPYDDQGHGTATADRVGGNGFCGAKGALPGVRLAIGKIASKDGTASGRDILRGIEWAVSQGASVVSISMGDQFPVGTAAAPLSFGSVNEVVAEAEEKGVLVVVSNGNNGVRPAEIGYLTSSPRVLPVGAAGTAGTRAQFSDPDPEILAWGYEVPMAKAGGGCIKWSGTSFSAPFAAGVAARVGQAYAASHDGAAPTPMQIREILHHTAKGRDDIPYAFEGYGMLQPEAAVAAAANPEALPPRDLDDKAFQVSMLLRSAYSLELSTRAP